MFHDELDTHTDIDIANEAATVALAVKIVDICGVPVAIRYLPKKH